VTTPFAPQNALEKALMEAAADAAARPAFYRILLESPLFFLTPEETVKAGKTVLEPGEQLQLVHWRGKDGPFVPFFSSMARVREASAKAGVTFGCLSIPGSEAFRLLAQQPTEAFLNPGLLFGKQFLPEEIRFLAQVTMADGGLRPVEKGTKILLGQPAESPAALLEALRKAFERNPTVEVAWLAQLHEPESGKPPHPIIGIQGSDPRGAMSEAGHAARAVGVGLLEFVDASVPTDEGIVGYLRNRTTPFYVRTLAKA
jgi:hypothetical protein